MNDLNLILEKYNPSVFETAIIGTLMSDKDPQLLYEKIRKRLKPTMFSEENSPIFSTIFEMLEYGESLRSYLIIERGLSRGHKFDKETITNYRMQCGDSDFTKMVDSFLSQWYQFNFSKNSIEFTINLQKGIEPLVAYRNMMQANEDLEQMKSEYSDTSITVADAARELIKEIDIRRKLPNPLVGLSFGNKQLDEMTGGAHIESLYLIAGAGGDGKTTLALQFAVFMSKYHKVDYYSLEMSVRQLTPKILSAGTGISKSSILHASVGDDQIKILSSEADNIEKTGIHIIDTIYDLNSLESSIRGRIKRNNTDAIFIDNRTNIRHNLKGSSTDDITIMLTYRFKNLAMEIKKPIFLLVHKNKESTSRADKRPTSSDIKYGGDIAADVIIFPYQPKNLEEPDKYGHYKYSEIVITKNRVMGDSGHIESLFDPDYDSYYCFGYDEKPIRNYNPYENNHNLNMDEKPKEAVNPNLITRQHAPADKEEIPF